MTSHPPTTDDAVAESESPAADTTATRRRASKPPRAPRTPVAQVFRELDWPMLLLVGIGVGIFWVLLLLQGGAIQILAGLLPVTGGILIGRRAKRHINWHAAVLGLLMSASALATVGVLIAIEIQRNGTISPLLLQAMIFAVVTLLPFPAFGVITAARSEERQRGLREEQQRRGGRLDRPGRVRSIEELRSLSLPQLGGYVADLFRKHGFLINDFKFEKERLDFQMTYEDEPWLVRVYTAEKVKPGAAQELSQRMRTDDVKKGIVITSMDFQEGAARWVKDKPIVLLDGPTLLSMND